MPDEPPRDPPAHPPPGGDREARHRGSIAIVSAAAGIAVASLYYAQPLAASIARSLGRGERAVGLALTLTQIGYATGMVLLVPLGDGRERRKILVGTALSASMALLLVAASTNLPTFAASSLLLGFASSLPQMLVPFAVGLVAPSDRGKAIGSVMSGLLAGILLSRTAGGIVAAAFGWRSTFVAAAVLMGALAVVLRVALPIQRPPEPMRWSKTVGSLGAVVRGEALLRKHAVIGAMGFASFSAFWSTLSFELGRLGYGSRTAGLFGAIGVVGVAVTPLVGRLASRVPATTINVTCLTVVAVAFAAFWAANGSLAWLAIGVVLLDAGVQGSHLANQNVIYGLRPELRNRLNAVYMVAYFAGGGLGSALAAFAWGAARWPGVCAVGVSAAIAGLIATRLRW